MNTSGESSTNINNNNNNMLEFQGYNQEPYPQPPFFSSNSSSLPPLPPPPPTLHNPFYEDAYTLSRRAALQFAYEGGGGGGGGFYNYNYMQGGGDIRGLATSTLASLPLGNACFEIGKAMSAQDIMDAKALAASKSHSEAERRRRERINAHFARLRSLLPSTTKTDKASLLAEVIQHVKELKRQTSEVAEESPLPTESDELTLDTTNENEENGKFILKASLCCDDRADLLPELIKALKALQLRTLKAEITTIGGRVKNVLVITGDYENFQQGQGQESVIGSIQEALKAVMERADEAVTGGGSKRQRTTSLATILEHNMV